MKMDLFLPINYKRIVLVAATLCGRERDYMMCLRVVDVFLVKKCILLR
jgi:hypothetical protein